MPEKFDDDAMSQMVTSSLFFQFVTNLEQFASQRSGAWSGKLTFSLIATFYLTKIENRTKNLKHSSHTIALSKGTIFANNC